MSPSQGRYLHTEQHKLNKGRQAFMCQMGFEPTIPVLERAKTMPQAARPLWPAYSHTTVLEMCGSVTRQHVVTSSVFKLGLHLWVCSTANSYMEVAGHPHSAFCSMPIDMRSRDSVVGTATSYGLDDRGVAVRVPVGSRIFSSPRRPDRFWGPPSLLSNGYRGLFPRG
jgi:hypothetical protein